MSDSERDQLHVPYREYHSQNNTRSQAALVETDALVDLSTTPPPQSTSSLSSLIATTAPQINHQFLGNKIIPPSLLCDTSDSLPEVEFSQNTCNDTNVIIDSTGIERESQPLLGRLELDVTFNRFSG